MNKFIDRYYNKWIVRGLVIVGVLFMLKLILMGVSIGSSTSGGFLALPAFWDFEYYWMSSSYIGLILIIISIYFIYKISKTKNKTNKILLALIIFFLGLISKQVFFLFSPDFKFYMTPVTSQYKDKEGNVTDVDKYLDSIGKYCDYKIGGALGYKRARVDMCTENDKYQTFFKTAEEYIKVLEYAKNHDNRLLYQRTYGGVNKFGVEKILEKYDDVTFQAYVISNGNIDESKQHIYRKVIKNTNIINLLNYYTESIDENKNLMINNLNHDIRSYWEKYNINLKIKIQNIPGVNYNIF